jgi:hypothetical protein
MSEPADATSCSSCGGPLDGDRADRRALCHACLRRIVRRSTVLAVFPALLVVALYGWLLGWVRMFESRFLMMWIALGALLGWVAFKVARRVLFEVVRGRGIQPGS